MSVGDYVVVKYDSDLYPAEITEIKGDSYQCNSMEAVKLGWRWPVKKDEIWYKSNDIVRKITEPIPISSRGTFKFDNFVR